jgi:hypothetical protein
VKKVKILFGISGLSLALSGCISTHTLNAILANQEKFEPPVGYQIVSAPLSIEITEENKLQDKTSATVAMITFIPLIIYNDIEINHHIFLGQSSLSVSTTQDLKQKVNEAFLKSSFPWKKVPKEEFQLTLNLRKTKAYGSYHSGWWGFFMGYGYTGAGHGERIHLSKNARSEITFTIALHQGDSTLFSKEKTIWIKKSNRQRCKGGYVDVATGETDPIPTYDIDDLNEQYVYQKEGDNKKENFHTPYIQHHLAKVYEVYQLSLIEMAQKIVQESENYFMQKYQRNNRLNLTKLK